MSNIRRRGEKKPKQAKNAIGRRIFRILLGTVIGLSIFFTTVNVLFVMRSSSDTTERLSELTIHVTNEIMMPLIDEKDQSVLNLTEGNAKSINRFFDNCENTAQIVADVAARNAADNRASSNGYVVPLPTAIENEQDLAYRLEATYFDRDNPDSYHVLEVMSRLRHVLTSVYRMDTNISSVYFASTEGFTLFADNKQSLAIDESGVPITFDPETRDWYKNAVESAGTVCGSLKTDYFSAEPMITISTPVYSNTDNTLLGVVALDVTMDTVEEMLGASKTDYVQVCVTNEAGDIQIATNQDGRFGLEPDGENNIYTSSMPTIQNVIDDSTAGMSGYSILRLDGEDREVSEDELHEKRRAFLNGEDAEFLEPDQYKVYYAPIPAVNWTYIYIAEVNSLTERINQIMDNFFMQTDSQRMGNRIAMMVSVIILIAVMVIILVVMYIVAGRLSHNVTEPIEELTKKVRQINGDNLEFSWDMEADEETTTLAESFGTMTEKIRDYIRDLTTVTAEKERISAELDVATKIQADMLPVNFPNREELKLYASMTPAKEVGGDFYDFFEIDEDRMGLVIADVSGKGVPAALFMVIAKTMIKNGAMTGIARPAEIFTKVNALLCEGNEEMLFVTAWIGILSLSTGEMVCVNAGHEYPALRKAGGQFRIIKDRHGVPLAAVENAKFSEYTMKLDPGDQLFVYTDGFPEAVNEANEQFAYERMLEAMNEPECSDPQVLDERLRAHVKEFTGDVSQFDDMTALGIVYYGPSAKG